MSVNTFIKITELSKSFKVAVYDMDTGYEFSSDTSKHPTLKAAINKAEKLMNTGQIEYGIQNIDLINPYPKVKNKIKKNAEPDPSMENYI